MSRGKFEARRRRPPFWYYALLVILAGILAFSIWYLTDYYLGSREQAAEFEDLAGLVDSLRPVQGPSPTETWPEGDFPTDSLLPLHRVPEAPENIRNDQGILLEYAPLYEANDHMAGWLQIEGTRINYPVMQTPGQEDYYLQRNFSREWSSWGCLYAREECDLDTPSDNVTIYGHNMKDGSMFAGLNDYTKREFWEEHRYIRFDTLKEHHVYEIFAVFTTTATEGQGFAYHNFIHAGDEQEFDMFIAKCLSNSLYGTDLIPEYGDKILCLSTCEYTQENGRLVVAAVRIR